MTASSVQSVSPAAEALRPEDLRALMEAVTETTERLQRTHLTLQGEVARLQGELAEANARLRRSQALAALGEMAAGIAHEIRNPLGSIQLNLQMLAEDLAGAPEQRELCRKIDRAVVGMDAIVRDVLAFARETRLDPAPTTAAGLFDRALASCEAVITAARVEVTRRDGPDGDLHADAGRVTQALGNVIRNAVEAMTDHDPAAPRRLVLTSERRTMRGPDGARAARVVLAVEDTGPGVPDAVVERMFNPFFTTRATGTGLGLAIVHRIVDAHGGHVNVTRGAAGGALVELCLPERPRPGRAARPAVMIETRTPSNERKEAEVL